MAKGTLVGPDPAQQAAQAKAANDFARQLCLAKGQRMCQVVYNKTFADNTSEPVISIAPRLVGLTTGFMVKVSFTVTNTGLVTDITPTDFGPANIFSNISFRDLENNERIGTPGWHLALVNSIKHRRPFGAALLATADDDPIGFGANWTVQSAPAVATGGTETWTYWYWVPLAYHESDLRGSMWLNVTGASPQLNLSFNQTPIAAAPTDDTGYIGTGNTGTVTGITVKAWQYYLDQIPRGQNGLPILPVQDMATVYELRSSVYTGMPVSVETGFDYSNFRDYVSTVACYFDGAARLTTNVNYWKLMAANMTTLWEKDPDLIALETRMALGYDLPKGFFYFGSRSKPIATVQYGNQQLVLNPSVAGAGAKLTLAYEDFALKNAVMGAQSIGGK